MATTKRTARKRSEGRTAAVKRTTKETSIQLTLAVDGAGRAEVNTGVPFLDHMLELFARRVVDQQVLAGQLLGRDEATARERVGRGHDQ